LYRVTDVARQNWDPMRDEIRRFLARHRRNRLIGKIGRNLGYYYQGFENQDYNTLTNGEAFVLRTLALVHPQAVVLDVGANRGDWARMAADAMPQGHIHSIEVIPATYAKLAETCADLPQVSHYNVGLGEASGQLEFSVSQGKDELASGLAGLHGDFHKFDFYKVTCPVLTGDSFCSQHKLEHIDLLKLDVEGLEPMVLKGFATMLNEKRIGAVQFEYGQINLKARFFLGDFYELLGSYGMKIGKIYPNHVDFRDYHFTQDTLTGPNFLAVSDREAEFARALAD
jgi:FkbM family methyltransferase